MHVKKAEFTRVIPSDGHLFGEVKVWPEKEEKPILVWFEQGEDGCLNMVKLIRKQEDLGLDWYDNNLHLAFQDVTEHWFGPGEPGDGCKRTEFEREVLDFGSVAPDLEQQLWQTHGELYGGSSDGRPSHAAITKNDGGPEQPHA